MYIVIEGQDATGKSTQVELLADYLRNQGKNVITLHEPNGNLDISHQLSQILKAKQSNLEPITQVLLFTAARLELWRKLAEPALKKGGYVISARNWWSTLAYQGYGQGISKNRIIRLTKEIMPKPYVYPDKSAILTLPETIRSSRQSQRNLSANEHLPSSHDAFESRPAAFQSKVNHAYLDIAKDFNIPLVDASPSPETLHANLITLFGI